MRTVQVIIESRGGHDGTATGGHYGDWARIWASRPGIAQVRIVNENHSWQPGRLSYHYDIIGVELTVDDAVLQHGDYVLIEHKRSPNPFLSGSPSGERYELVAGEMPAWAAFPQAWYEWVRGPARDRAIDALRSLGWLIPDLEDKIAYALRKTSKRTTNAAWQGVARLIREAGYLRREPRFSYSWTGIKAMPIQIARAVDWRRAVREADGRAADHIRPFDARAEGMPRYQSREEAGAVLVCDPRHLPEGQVKR